MTAQGLRALKRALVARVGRQRAVLAVRLATLPVRLLAAVVVRALPRDPRLVAFGAPLSRFADNTAYLYLALASTPGLRCVWITGSPGVLERLRREGLEAHPRRSWRGVWLSSRAGWWVIAAYVADINRWTHHGARVLNLWHGAPLKVIERDITSGPLASMFRARPRWSPVALAYADDTRRPDYVLTPSAVLAERCFVTAFDVPQERCLPFGYPRTDHFFAAPRLVSDALVRDTATWRCVAAAPFVVAYFPTWRDDGADFLARSGLRVAELAGRVRGHGGLLVFKAHYNTALELEDADGLVLLDAEDDVDAYLPLASVLITDYSSLAFDFMLLDRPILYFVPDLEEYTRSRGFYFPPESMMAGPRLRSPQALFRALDAVAAAPSPDADARRIRDAVWGDYRGGASERLTAFLAAAARPPAARS